MSPSLPLKIVIEDSRTCRPLDEALVHDGVHPYLSLMVNDSIMAGPEAQSYRVLSRRWSRGGLGEYHFHVLRIEVALAETSVADTPTALTRTQLSDVSVLLEAWDRWDGCSKASRAALRLRDSLNQRSETAPPDERKVIGALGDHIDDMRCRAAVADDPEEGIEGGSTVAEVLREEAEALENLLRLWPWPAPPDVVDAWCRLTAFGWFRVSDESEIVGSYLLCCKPFTYPKGVVPQ